MKTNVKKSLKRGIFTHKKERKAVKKVGRHQRINKCKHGRYSIAMV